MGSTANEAKKFASTGRLVLLLVEMASTDGQGSFVMLHYLIASHRPSTALLIRTHDSAGK